MKILMKTGLGLAVAAMFVTVALAGPAAAKRPVPFVGFLHGAEVDAVEGNPPTTIHVDGHARAIASLLGRVSVTYEATVSLPQGSAVGTLRFIEADGDSISTEFLGQGTPTEIPNVSHIVEVNTVTGGTGRFAGATGTFTVERLVDLSTGLTFGSFRGTLSVPGAH